MARNHRKAKASTSFVKWLASHFRTDFDEMLGIFFLWFLPEANKVFPGVNEAVIRFWNAGRKTPDGKEATPEWVHRNQTLPIGVGSSQFDEHPRHGADGTLYEREEGLCAALLVARALGIENDPRYRSLLVFASRVNNTATADTEDISRVVKLLHDNGDTSVEDIFYWVVEGIFAKSKENPESPEVGNFTIDHIAQLIREQGERDDVAWLKMGRDAIERDNWLFHNVSLPEYQKKKRLVMFRSLGRNGQLQELKLVAIRSDDPRIHRVARSKLGDQVAVTVQMRSNGTCTIMSNKYYHLKLHDVSRVIKFEEALARGEEPPSWHEARQELQHGVWYYFQPGEMLFNGSLTAPETPPTRLPLGRIVELVKLALSPEEFAPDFVEHCCQGVCRSRRNDPCPWYHWGLGRCQTIRFHRRETLKAAEYVPPEILDEE